MGRSKNFIAFGNDELKKAPKLKDEILCVRCGKMHKIIYGETLLPDGTRKQSKTLAAVKCGDRLILVGVAGKNITLHQRKN